MCIQVPHPKVHLYPSKSEVRLYSLATVVNVALKKYLTKAAMDAKVLAYATSRHKRQAANMLKKVNMRHYQWQKIKIETRKVDTSIHRK